VARASVDQPPAIDAFSVRKQAKDHGIVKRVEGNFAAGDKVVIIEDVITSGGSALQAIEAVTAEGGVVLGVLAVVDREQGGRAKIEAAGFPVTTLVTATTLGLRK
jgi:orotate phosphoribosyltransferase